MGAETYVEIRLYRFDPEESVPFEEPPAGLISARALPFANLANATVVYENAKKTIDGAAERGVHLLSERVKPGRKPRG